MQIVRELYSRIYLESSIVKKQMGNFVAGSLANGLCVSPLTWVMCKVGLIMGSKPSQIRACLIYESRYKFSGSVTS